ncbi:hypothetical protein PBI_LUCKY2013_85 [Mycobacterium phage Lucky2013]|uniref:Uncharacterized protein n=2 Tax=Omegavirus courthouse TaxID=1089119 RepID=G8I5E0_9CAUD|nr:hypothetical protein CM09_gp083 [Mycobacterium phage Courthouse]YP_009205217.1 hypothetical protein AVT17_gp087 [Mycobacterium phage Ariel]YP_009213305.1 hypothetical protein AVV70_gp088 [Mycobacterium phage MiaZeal]ASD50883.1 hypothetical protein PORCELAIN_87 [Mycobacterium phage Porcelain]ASD53478.1 hypothetical protein PBI_LUCKY2013_85 [Mycobacterium phage Lucky2013]ATS93080.1 hypothetical protein SEA_SUPERPHIKIMAN_85 [Mycobacterium phage Superphikiman]AER47934.1 hypothetical protein CO
MREPAKHSVRRQAHSTAYGPEPGTLVSGSPTGVTQLGYGTCAGARGHQNPQRSEV